MLSTKLNILFEAAQLSVEAFINERSRDAFIAVNAIEDALRCQYVLDCLELHLADLELDYRIEEEQDLIDWQQHYAEGSDACLVPVLAYLELDELDELPF